MIALVAAVAENGVIGAKNKLPWHIPEDLQHFKKITAGKTVLMGRKTFESIIKKLGGPLPGRTNIVITRQKDLAAPKGVKIYHSLDDALKNLIGEDVYVIGGEEIYAQTIDEADILYLTHVEKKIAGDVYFPNFSKNDWELIGEEKRAGFRFAVYKRNKTAPG